MTELDAAARQILKKVRMFLADATRFGVLSSGERIAGAVVLDRYDSIQRAWGTIAWPLHGPQRHCACNATAGRRTAPTNHLPRPAHGRVGRFPGNPIPRLHTFVSRRVPSPTECPVDCSCQQQHNLASLSGRDTASHLDCRALSP